MYITKIHLKNWKNFRQAEIPLQEYTYLLGANASGKSNLLDVFRFLHDITMPQGGGLQKAIADRGGITKLRCLHARRDPEVRIEVDLADSFEAERPEWQYKLAFKPEGKGAQRILIVEETVIHHGKKLFERPTKEDRADPLRLTQTYLEQIQTNADFRAIAAFFSGITYLHLVPQLLKYSDRIGGNFLEGDPFGQAFLKSLARTTEKTRDSRLKKIETALALAVPQFEALQFEPDAMGYPHLQARYKHYRPNAGLQREDQFSDGTLRLIGMLWSLLESNTMLLLEEPELSLHAAIVACIPEMMQRVRLKSKHRRQVVLTTHSAALLENKGIDGRGVIVLEPGTDGTKTRKLTHNEVSAVKSGLSLAEVVLPKTRPEKVAQLAFL